MENIFGKIYFKEVFCCMVGFVLNILVLFIGFIKIDIFCYSLNFSANIIFCVWFKISLKNTFNFGGNLLNPKNKIV